MQDPQLWIVLGAVVVAVGFLIRRQRRVRKGVAPVCGNCDQCQAPSKRQP